MTDEQYIEKLILKGFEQRQVNQLLKIYTYTKKYELDLSNIDLSVDDDRLREIANDFREGKYNLDDESHFYYLKYAIDSELDVVSYLDPKFTSSALITLISAERSGLDVSMIKNPNYSEYQLRVLLEGLQGGYDIAPMCDPNLSNEEMGAILIAIRNGVDILPYIGKYDEKQLNAINDILKRNKKLGEIDLSNVIKPEYSAKQMYILELAIRGNYDTSLLSKTCYSDEHLDLIYQLLSNDRSPDLISDETLSINQVRSITHILMNEERPESFDYSMILNKKYNWATIDLFGTIACETSLLFELPKMMDESYSFEKVYEIWCGISNDLDINKYKDLEDIREIHFVRRMLEHQKNNPDFDISYFIDSGIDIVERMKKYVELKSNKIKFTEIKDENTRKSNFSLSIYHGDQQYFLTDRNTIVEVGYDDDPMPFEDLGVSSSIDEAHVERDFLREHYDDIESIIRDFFIFIYDEETEEINLYDIFTDRIVEKRVDEYYNDCILDYSINDGYVYGEIVDDTILYLEEEYTEKYEPAFEGFGDLAKHGGPDIDSEVLIKEINTNYECYTLSLSKEEIKNIYGEVNEETMNKAYNLICAESKMLEDYCDGYNFYYREYNLEGIEIDSCWGFVGYDAIVDIEDSAGNFIKDLGEFDCIEDCIEAISCEKEEIDEER